MEAVEVWISRVFVLNEDLLNQHDEKIDTLLD